MNEAEKTFIENLWGKEAEVANTDLMPAQEPTNKSPKSKTVISKEGSMSPHVDVSDLPPQAQPTQKHAQHYALPAHQRYPLDSYAQVKTAASYFEENKGAFAPTHRREFCVNLQKRAAALGIATSPDIEKYASATYADDAHIDIALDGRRLVLNDGDALPEMLDKLAEQRRLMSPEDFAITLQEFDKVAGIDQYYDSAVMDPYYSTFGVKEAAFGAVVIGNEYMRKEDLQQLASFGRDYIATRFGDDFADEFKKDPEGIFKSLPLDQKKVIMRMATDTASS